MDPHIKPAGAEGTWVRYLGPTPFYYQATRYCGAACDAVGTFAAAGPVPSSGADDAGGAGKTGIRIPCTAPTVPPNKDESHHNKATSRGASRVKKHFTYILPACLPAWSSPHLLRLLGTYSVPTCAQQQRPHARLLQCCEQAVAQVVIPPTLGTLEGAKCQGTLVARVLSQQAGNSLSPAPPIATTPPADRGAGLAAGHFHTVPQSSSWAGWLMGRIQRMD